MSWGSDGLLPQDSVNCGLWYPSLDLRSNTFGDGPWNFVDDGSCSLGLDLPWDLVVDSALNILNGGHWGDDDSFIGRGVAGDDVAGLAVVGAEAFTVPGSLSPAAVARVV